MSGVASGIKKTFKKVGKVAKIAVPIALAAGAIYFTAGAALGVSGAAGGWGAAATSMSQTLGLSGTLGNVVAGAATQAGYGAVIGAATSAITGGDIAEGALYGAGAGAVSGGVTGGLRFNADPLASSTGGTSGPMNINPANGPTGTIAPPPGSALTDVGPAVTGGNEGSSTLGGLFSKGGWLERNGQLVGNLAQGVGGGLLKGMAADDEAEALANRDARRTANYGLPGAANTLPSQTTKTPGPSAPTVDEKYGQRIRYAYNRETGIIEPVAV